jgi:hypothetical protein
MALGLLSHINPADFISLALVDVFVCEETFLADEGHLFVSPDFHTEFAFLLDFLFKLLNGSLEVVCVVLTLLCGLKEKFSLFIEFAFHCFLNGHLFLH